MKKRSLLLAPFAFLLVAGQGCADSDNSIYIKQVISPPVPGEDGCLYTADADQPNLPQGVMDIGLTGSYAPNVLIANQITNGKNVEELRNDTGTVIIKGAVVSVSEPNGALIREFTTVTAGNTSSTSSTEPGYGAPAITMIDAATSAILAPAVTVGNSRLVVAKVRAFGTTVGGTDVESQEFTFPITVCRGCLVSGTGANCDDATDKKPPCRFGQDQDVDRCLCKGYAVCQ